MAIIRETSMWHKFDVAGVPTGEIKRMKMDASMVKRIEGVGLVWRQEVHELPEEGTDFDPLTHRRSDSFVSQRIEEERVVLVFGVVERPVDADPVGDLTSAFNGLLEQITLVHDILQKVVDNQPVTPAETATLRRSRELLPSARPMPRI